VRFEWVLKVTGTVRKRPAGMENPRMATGEIEVIATGVEVISAAKPMPFMVSGEEQEADENTRLRYRYLDLRPRAHDAQHAVAPPGREIHARVPGQPGFIEIETPILFKATPEGARDYLVPSRIYPASSTPFRNHPSSSNNCSWWREWIATTRLPAAFGMKTSAATDNLNSRNLTSRCLLLSVMTGPGDGGESVCGNDPCGRAKQEAGGLPWPKLSHAQAVERFGTDKPDLRFGMELTDVTGILANTESAS